MTTIIAPLDRPRVASQTPMHDRAIKAPAIALCLAAALVVSGWTIFFDRRVAYPLLSGSIVAALAFLALTWPIARRGMLKRAALAAAELITLAAVVCTADRAISAWEERAPWFGAASSIASGALNLLGYRATAEQGLLMLDHPDGLVTIAPSMEKLAVRPLLLFGIAWVVLWLIRGHRRAAAATVVGLAAMLLVGMLRYVALLAVYAECDDILAGVTGLAALDWFASSWITGGFLVLAGLAVDRAVHGRAVGDAPRSEPAPARPRVWAILGAGVTVAGLAGLAGFAATFAPPGAEKTGRILVDDRYCGIWEPTARQLDTEWYGDFPTYSFTSLAEWLGKWYSVDVNTSRAYDDELFSGYDIFILKTPEEPMPEAELKAIDRFVRRGGGLLLVGDHTNLLGMGTHLNALSAQYGIRFRYDSVSDGLTGGFVDCFGPRIGRHVGALHVDHLQFMTSCSLQISGNAETVLAADECRREPHDYAGSSCFGRHGAHPEMEHGRTVLAATVRVGRGRIAAFTDSTVWSSFAVFSLDREKLAMDLIRLLNRETSPFEAPIRCLAVAAGLIAGFLGLKLVGSGLALPAIVLALAGSWMGMAASENLHRRVYAWPSPNAPITEVTFLWQGGACAFPPVLGTPDSVPLDRSYDTLLVAVQRLGLVPRVAYSYDEDLLSPATRAMFVIAPVNTPPPRTMARLKDFVRDGGSLIVMDDSRMGERGSAKDFLRPFDASITYHGSQGPEGGQKPHVHIGGMEQVQVPAADAFLARKLFERGHVIYMWDAADFSRQGLGHCFARPWKSARARYETIFAVLRDVLRIAPADRRFYGVL
ncbi:MAG: hypothetical protein ACHRXM_01375 [Isosphaerales bacterium]